MASTDIITIALTKKEFVLLVNDLEEYLEKKARRYELEELEDEFALLRKLIEHKEEEQEKAK